MEEKGLVTKEMGIYSDVLRFATHPDYQVKGLATKLIEEQE